MGGRSRKKGGELEDEEAEESGEGVCVCACGGGVLVRRCRRQVLISNSLLVMRSLSHCSQIDVM